MIVMTEKLNLVEYAARQKKREITEQMWSHLMDFLVVPRVSKFINWEYFRKIFEILNIESVLNKIIIVL